MLRPRPTIALACACAACSCSQPAPATEKATTPPRACSAESDPGVLIEVRDSVTLLPLTNAVLRVFSGGRVVDSAHSLVSDRRPVPPLGAVYERPGVFDVSV